MIDTNDKTTQALDLGAEPKRRGRPATGQALSNAERQRLYRERQKAQRKENMNMDVAEDLRAELAKALETIEFLDRKNAELMKQLRKQQDQLEQRNEKEREPAGRWVVQMKTNSRSRWKTLTPKGNEWGSEREAEESITLLPSGKNCWYRTLKL